LLFQPPGAPDLGLQQNTDEEGIHANWRFQDSITGWPIGALAKEKTMRERIFNAIAARPGESLSRRASLLGLGTAALAAALANAIPAHAGKAGKKAKKACKRQVGQCETSVVEFCARIAPADPEDQALCQDRFTPCCQSFNGCKAGDAYECLFNILRR
jgi:hypothetical protein